MSIAKMEEKCGGQRDEQLEKVEWEVHKFGGSCCENYQAYLQTTRCIQSRLSPENSNRRLFVVVSAIKGVTNLLLDLLRALTAEQEQTIAVQEIVQKIKNAHDQTIPNKTSATSTILKAIHDDIDSIVFVLSQMRQMGAVCSLDHVKGMMGYGEIWSAWIMGYHLKKQVQSKHVQSKQVQSKQVQSENIKIKVLSARKRIKIDEHGEIAHADIQSYLDQKSESETQSATVLIMGGFVGSNVKNGSMATVSRNGSDYTAAFIAQEITKGCSSGSLHIWSDVAGVHTIDPKIIPLSPLILKADVDDILFLSKKGSRVLHYHCLQIAKTNSFNIHCHHHADPDADGTIVISNAATEQRRPILFSVSNTQNLHAVRIETTDDAKNQKYRRQLLESLKKIPKCEVLSLTCGDELKNGKDQNVNFVCDISDNSPTEIFREFESHIEGWVCTRVIIISVKNCPLQLAKNALYEFCPSLALVYYSKDDMAATFVLKSMHNIKPNAKTVRSSSNLNNSCHLSPHDADLISQIYTFICED